MILLFFFHIGLKGRNYYLGRLSCKGIYFVFVHQTSVALGQFYVKEGRVLLVLGQIVLVAHVTLFIVMLHHFIIHSLRVLLFRRGYNFAMLAHCAFLLSPSPHPFHSLWDRWGTTEGLATSFLQSSLCSTSHRVFLSFRLDHSPMVSSHLFLCLFLFLPP